MHRRLGPGLLESAYRACLAYELRKRGFEVREEVPVPVAYDDVKLECGFRADLIVNGKIVVGESCAWLRTRQAAIVISDFVCGMGSVFRGWAFILYRSVRTSASCIRQLMPQRHGDVPVQYQQTIDRRTVTQ